MTLEDLAKLFKGAKAKGLDTLGQLATYCQAHGLNTNAQKLRHFAG